MRKWMVWCVAIVGFFVVVQTADKSMSLDVYPGKWVPIIEFHWGKVDEPPLTDRPNPG